MPTETKNSTAKASLQRLQVGLRLVARCSERADHHAGEEGAERDRDVEQLSRSRRRRRARRDQHASVNSSRDWCAPTQRRIHGNTPRADDEHERDEQRHLAERDGERQRKIAGRCPARRLAAQHAGERRQQHQREHRDEVFHHQPADRDAAVARRRACRSLLERRSSTTVLATDSASPKSRPAAERPAPQVRRARARVRWPRGSAPARREWRCPDRQQVAQREVQCRH